jgi:SAM-dependent methyltransferase
MSYPRGKQPLHDQAPTTRFSDRAADYEKFRPTYPASAIDLVLEGVADPKAIVAADVGAGTGISSRMLADRGVRVLAIEPNAAMAAAATPHQLVRFVCGTAEATTLTDRSVDLVLCAQAFHWFRPTEALREFARVLRRSGRVALVWNILDQRDPVTSDYVGAIRTAISGEPPEMMDLDPALMEFQGFTRPELRLIPHEQALDQSGFVRRAMSASYVPKVGPASEALRAELARVHASHAGPDALVRLRYQTHVFRSDRA